MSDTTQIRPYISEENKCPDQSKVKAQADLNFRFPICLTKVGLYFILSIAYIQVYTSS